MVEDNNNGTDRILFLSKINGKGTIGSTGLIDNRLFTGENKLHAMMNPSGLWELKYDSGSLPEFLRQQFTSFSILLREVKQYFYKRNIEIKEIKNAAANTEYN